MLKRVRATGHQRGEKFKWDAVLLEDGRLDGYRNEAWPVCIGANNGAIII